ncbi:DUF4166 domain-containing protein [bacterium]|nr:MAG: DUF4166 domain-containing protein [bacterium]
MRNVNPYAELLEKDWDGLPLGVRLSMTAPLQATGNLRVWRAEKGMAGWLARRMELPPVGEVVPTHLLLVAEDGRVRWERTFAGMRAVSHQAFRNGRIVESAGPFQIELILIVNRDEVIHRQTAVRAFGLRVPALFGPRVDGTVSCGPTEMSWRVQVEIGHPMFGAICRYDGVMVAE